MMDTNLYNKGEEHLHYNEELWLEKAFKDYSKNKYGNRIIKNALLTENYSDTSWYKFIKAVKWYKPVLYRVLEENGLTIVQ